MLRSLYIPDKNQRLDVSWIKKIYKGIVLSSKNSSLVFDHLPNASTDFWLDSNSKGEENKNVTKKLQWKTFHTSLQKQFAHFPDFGNEADLFSADELQMFHKRISWPAISALLALGHLGGCDSPPYLLESEEKDYGPVLEQTLAFCWFHEFLEGISLLFFLTK